MQRISVVIPVYNEAENLPELHRRLSAVADRMADRAELEFLLTDDGSIDGTDHVLREMAERDPRVVVTRLSRNFGSYAGLKAGFEVAQGDYVACISADLQDPPEIIESMYEKAVAEDLDVCWGVREQRKDPWHKILLANCFYWLIRKTALPQMPKRGVDVYLIRRRIRDRLLDLKDRNTFPYGLILWMGFKQATIPYNREARLHGTSKWSLARRIKTAMDVIISFSFLPIRAIAYVGILVSVLGFIYAMIVVGNLLLGNPSPGWSSVVILVALVGGLQLLMLGVIGEYLWRVAEQGRERPDFFVDYRIDRRPEVDSGAQVGDGKIPRTSSRSNS